MPAAPACASRASGQQIPITTGAVDIGYFETMGIGVVAGRDFTSSDLSQGASTVVVTESLARRLWPDTPAVGESVVVGCKDKQPAVVVGVVRDSAIGALGEPAQAHLYQPFARQYKGGLVALLLEARTEPGAAVQSVRSTLLGMGQGIRVYTVQPLSAYVDQSYVDVRWEAAVLSGFGLLALTLAGIGLYGVIAYRVSLRTQEIGVRMALGAGRAAIFRDILWQGLAIVFAGVAVGEVLALALTRLAASRQVGVHPPDGLTHLVVGSIWIVVALVACYVPAARASRVDPLVALRCE
jgi:hypothetical protein